MASVQEAPPKRRLPMSEGGTQPRQRRVVLEKGRAHTSADIDLPDWNSINYIHPDFEGKVHHWFPGAKKKSAQAGEPFVFRLLPALSTQIEGMEIAEGAFSDWKPGRETDGSLNNAMFRQVGVIEQFGSNRQVSFIPCLPYDTPDAPSFSGLNDNPYQLLCDALFQMKSSGLDPNWAPLVMTKKEIDAYRDKHGLQNKVFSASLLPMRNSRYFGYAWIYRGYNTATQKDFHFKNIPYGAHPKHGLQIISISRSAFQALGAEYRRSLREGQRGQNRFLYPDPAQFDEGTLNYVWLAKTTNPIDGTPGSDNVMGYTGAVSQDYFAVPESPVETDLTVGKEFQDWYYENWQPWSEVLKGTWGQEQVFLIAKYFPELKGVCKRIWSGHKKLMPAWEEAFASVTFDEHYDFHEILHRKYGLPGERSADVDDRDRPDAGDYETTTRRPPAGSKVQRSAGKRRPPSDLESEDFDYDSDAGEETQQVRPPRKFAREQEPERKPKRQDAVRSEARSESRSEPRRPPVEKEPLYETDPEDDDVPLDEPEQPRTSPFKNVLDKVGSFVQQKSAPARKASTRMTADEYAEQYEDTEPDYDDEDFEDAENVLDTDDMDSESWDDEAGDTEYEEEVFEYEEDDEFEMEE